MKIAIVSNSDTKGGAARASFRLMLALVNNDTDCFMIVKNKQSCNKYVIENSSKWGRLKGTALQKISTLLSSFQKTSSVTLHSLNIFGSDVDKVIERVEPNLLNLHWINFETLSIRQVAKLNKPVVMTLHDMWAFCGAEHLAQDYPKSAFRTGYTLGEHDYISGIKLNKLVWELKKKYWTRPFHIVVPSHWMANCARESDLFRGWDINVIPNTLDTHTFKPLDKVFCREVLNLPQNKKLVGFGAFGGGKDPNKGFDLLNKSLSNLRDKEDYHCVVFGQSENSSSDTLPISSTFLGHLSDDTTLSIMYNALDVMIVPSRQESLSQTATESTSCGTPVVAFACTGLLDVVDHMKTGFLAKPFDASDLTEGIMWCIENNRNSQLSINARQRAKKLWAYDVVATQYIQLFETVIAKDKGVNNG